MISPRTLIRLLPILAALLLPAQPAGSPSAPRGDAVMASHEHRALSRRGFVTRKQRHATGLEEYFAIDDDADQHISAPPRVIASELQGGAVFAERRRPSCYRERPPSHPACAAPPTGPPSA